LESIVDVILEISQSGDRAVAVHREELVLSEFLDELKQNAEGTIFNPRIAVKWD